MQLKGFVGPSYVSLSPLGDQEETINLYEEKIESPGGTVRSALYPIPGFDLLVNTISTNARAHEFFLGREFWVVGGAFFETDEDSAITFHGSVTVDTNPATISSNGDAGGQLFITSGTNGYIFDMTAGTLSAVAALAGLATMGASLDGYFIALNSATGTFYISDLLDGTTWQTGTQFAQRIAASDPWVSLKVLGPYIWLLGTKTSEVWFDSGASPFPFEKHPSGLIQWGTCAPFSVTVCDTSLCWLGASANGQGFFLRTSGFSPEVISTYAVQLAVNAYEVVTDAYGDTYNYEGHTFFILSFPSAQKTWAYDLQLQSWTRRGSWDTVANDYGIWRPRCHALAFGQHRWGHGSGVGIYRMDRAFMTDVDDLPIRRERRAPAVFSENKRVRHKSLELLMDVGVGTETGQGENPQIMMQMSDDGGKTFGIERWASIGKIGEYDTRVHWDRLGMARKRVYRVVMTDPVRAGLLDAFLEIEKEAS
jgi:hypothetical protein